jgi:glycine cleavage system H protein
VVFFDPPQPGAQVTKDEAYAEVESVKAVSDVFAPLSGEILEVNEALADSPEKINEDPYGEGWLVRVRLTQPDEVDALLDVGAYRELL